MRTFGCDASSSAILNSVSSHDAKFRRKEPLGMIFRKGTADRREEQRTVSERFNTRSKNNRNEYKKRK